MVVGVAKRSAIRAGADLFEVFADEDVHVIALAVKRVEIRNLDQRLRAIQATVIPRL